MHITLIIKHHKCTLPHLYHQSMLSVAVAEWVEPVLLTGALIYGYLLCCTVAEWASLEERHVYIVHLHICMYIEGYLLLINYLCICIYILYVCIYVLLI